MEHNLSIDCRKISNTYMPEVTVEDRFETNTVWILKEDSSARSDNIQNECCLGAFETGEICPMRTQHIFLPC